jgi:hypothetical protein
MDELERQVPPEQQLPPEPQPQWIVPAGDEGAEPLTVIARFAERQAADACAEDLRQHGIEVSLHQKTRSQAASRLNNGVAMGAGLGATAGLMAASILFPPFSAAFATGSLVSTLAGAGLGSLLADMMQGRAPGAAPEVFLVIAVEQERVDLVRRLIVPWQPLEIRVA